MEEKVRAHAVISGRVQGVFFRQETQRTAERNQVAGWVRNLRDGTVEAVLEGEKKGVEDTLTWCGQGPSRARVEHVEVRWLKYTGEFTNFKIRH